MVERRKIRKPDFTKKETWYSSEGLEHLAEKAGVDPGDKRFLSLHQKFLEEVVDEADYCGNLSPLFERIIRDEFGVKGYSVWQNTTNSGDSLTAE